MIQLFIAILLFTFLALGGLVADLGLVRLTQRTMQGATDAAALEGVRLSDAASDADRRAAAKDMVGIHFDDDFGATAADPYQFGAGPLVTLSGGQGSMLANQQVDVDPAVVYEPDLQLNLSNLRHGDMVSGSFDAIDALHLEDPSYARTDFGPGAADDAFLVRMRRTLNEQGLDAQPGVSSSGPTIPYLFGRGSMMASGMRGRGVTVRSTSIARSRHVTLVGPPREALGLTGYGPVALEYELWQEIDAGDVFVLAANSEGRRGRGRGATGRPDPNPFPFGPPIIPPGQVNGSTTTPNWAFLEAPADVGSLSIGAATPVRTDLDRASLVALFAAYGIDVTDLDEDGETIFVNATFHVAVFWGDVRIPWDGVPGRKWDNVDPDGLRPRVVGFGSIDVVSIALDLDEDDDDDEGRFRVTLRKRDGLTWPSNVSAVSTPGMAGLDPTTARGIAGFHRDLDESSRAAALAR